MIRNIWRRSPTRPSRARIECRRSRRSFRRLAAQSEYLGTQGNGKTPSGRFVTNDGVHMYRDWAVLHQDLTADTFTQDRHSARRRRRSRGASQSGNRAARFGRHRDARLLRAAGGAAQVRHRTAGARPGPARARHQPEPGARPRSGAQRRRQVSTAVQCASSRPCASRSSPWKAPGWIWPCCCFPTSTRISRSWTT